MRVTRTGALVLSLVFASCSHSSQSANAPLPPRLDSGSSIASVFAAGKIRHIVFIVQENRTVDNLFGGPHPFPGADAVSSGMTSDGRTVALIKQELECGDLLHCSQYDPNNYHAQWLEACNPTPGSGPPFAVGAPAPCRMNGFNIAQQSGTFIPDLVYSYVDYTETKPYWDIARAYTLGDEFFMSHNSESYTAHQYIFSGQSGETVDQPYNPNGSGVPLALSFLEPWGCDSKAGTELHKLNAMGQVVTGGGFPCFNYRSMADLANAASRSWRLYSYAICENVNAFDVNRTIRYGGAWPTLQQAVCPFPLSVDTTHFRSPEGTILKDVARGDLADITWVIPGPLSSDHPGVPFGECGPTWVSQIVNAIGRSPMWDSTAIFIFWDDWGGFYDHVAPYVVRDQEGPGFRVPLLVVSPYAKHDYISHSKIEVGTLLKFTESTFGLGSLGQTDASPYIGNMDDFFDFSKTQPFIPISAPSLFCRFDGAFPNLTPTQSRWLQMIHADND